MKDIIIIHMPLTQENILISHHHGRGFNGVPDVSIRLWRLFSPKLWDKKVPLNWEYRAFKKTTPISQWGTFFI